MKVKVDFAAPESSIRPTRYKLEILIPENYSVTGKAQMIKINNLTAGEADDLATVLREVNVTITAQPGNVEDFTDADDEEALEQGEPEPDLSGNWMKQVLGGQASQED